MLATELAPGFLTRTCSFSTARLDSMRNRIRDGAHRIYRSAESPDVLPECEAEGLGWPRRVARAFRRVCEAETPVVLPGERILFTRTTPGIPPLYRDGEWKTLTGGSTLHELGPISNICADWGFVLGQGLLERRRVAMETASRPGHDERALEFLACAIETIDAVLALVDRYAETARKMGLTGLAAILEKVPGRPPETFHEALQALRILHAMVWLEGHYHVGLGRFDQYMWPYLEGDLESGRITLAGAEELLAEFFISLNKDSDLYPGVQQGDNGQTIMLGGVRHDGSPAVNELTAMAIRVALYTNMIDPKINLRISADTDLSLLGLAGELTRNGLGFPQYSNDEVVIPALVKHGYDLEDARDYTVAACWEFIIPGKGMEVVNTGAVSLPLAADKAIRQGLSADVGFEAILGRAADNIRERVFELADKYRRLLLPPAPYYSVLMEGCLENGRDLSRGLKYNNFGLHAAASANAADALAAVKRFVFDERSVTADELLEALDGNFENHESLRRRLTEDAPKVGNDEEADQLMVRLFEFVAEACEAIEDNGRGGKMRPGTGSAMYYIWLARGEPGDAAPPIGATAEGRKRGEFFSANLAPSPNAAIRGPIGVLQAFSRIDYGRICNGGPITMELSDLSFRDEDSIAKCALLVRTFAQLGCQQLQLNALNAETLLDAKRHPELHRNLIVRVWGWSGYFCELAPEYQDHVVARQLYGL
jgi:formate C-acetyltransferase